MAAGTDDILRSGPQFERAKLLARDGSVEDRRKIAGNRRMAPEILYFLSEDEDAGVREAVACNPLTPWLADRFLAGDVEDNVRGKLAEKIASLTPTLGKEERGAVSKMTVEVLELLAQDEVVRVRAMLAEAIKGIPEAPPEVVGRVIELLARDQDLTVAAPVLQHSPLLSDAVLIEIIEGARVQGAVAAISSRSNVSEPVADAIVATDDEMAIVALLKNDSAQLREAMLDRLVEQAPTRPSYHEPLVRRPKLSMRHALELSKFVAVQLVAELQRRADFDDKTGALLSEELSRRIEADPDGARDIIAEHPVGERNRAVQLHNSGQLTDKALADALNAGRRTFVLAALGLRAQLDEPVVHSLVNSKNPRAITALSWKCGMNMAFALQLQLKLGWIEHKNALRPDADGNFPLRDDDMAWQIEIAQGESKKRR